MKDGADTSGESNLYMGLSGAEAILGYTEDPGVPDLGHRRWLLDPGRAEFGSGSTGTTNALSVAGSHGNGSRMKALADDELVAWPAPGWFPSPWIFKQWSAAIGNGGSGTRCFGSPGERDPRRRASHRLRHPQLDYGSGTGKTLGWQTACRRRCPQVTTWSRSRFPA